MKKIRTERGVSLWVEKQGSYAKWTVKKDGSSYDFETQADAERFIEDAFGESPNSEPSVVECGMVELKPVDRLGE